MTLIIVESPTKARTISKFLDKKYTVESSFGHIRDLPKSDMGIDIPNGFTPKYIIPTAAKKTVSNLKKQAALADTIILASDEDREGEAIAWHLAEALKIDPAKAKRIVFHEITKEAILSALEHPRNLDMKMVDAQQARRVLDRLVGYELSPFLWKKVAKGLSAGRVQSVAMRLVVEREKEIKAFKSDEYWSVTADLETKKQEKFSAELYKISDKSLDKLEIDATKAEAYRKDLESSEYTVEKVEKKKVSKNAPAPFTTSTLQQSANRHLGYSAKQTMTLAQKLYEQGYITYMRTDSLNLSGKFLGESAKWLKDNLGADYVLSEPRIFKTKNKNAQEAHEAIRPTEVLKDPESLKDTLERGNYRLYKLIWERAVASQMPPAILSATTIYVKADKYGLRASGQVLDFPGYLKVYREKTSEQELPLVTKADLLKLLEIKSEQHFTKAPGRYSDATLVKELEKHGIGRPSTYAPTINTIITRGYVSRDDNKKLEPSDIAFVVSDLLIAHFPEIIDYKFTAKMEDDLDKVATGEEKWQPIIKNFYDKFHGNLETKYEEINKTDIMPEEISEEKCEKCGAKMLIKTGRYGKFLACSGFPACKNIKSLGGPKEGVPENPKMTELTTKYAGEKCEKCGADMAVKNGKYGPFLACTAYPKCKNIKNIKTSDAPDVKCPVCNQGNIVKKFSKRGAFYACDNYPSCKNAYYGEPTGANCPKCGGLLIRDAKMEIVKCSNRECTYKEKAKSTSKKTKTKE
ncbi:MAG: type I DNA topoisomerase [Candidatus Falkowbacteria bacterium]